MRNLAKVQQVNFDTTRTFLHAFSKLNELKLVIKNRFIFVVLVVHYKQ